MSYTIDSIKDLTLELFEAITRRKATATLSEQLKDRIDMRRKQFLSFVEGNRNAHMYGITTRHHVGAKQVLSPEGFDEFAARLPASGGTFGPLLPDRLVRGIVVCRLADYINGTGALRASTVGRVLELLQQPQLPGVPARGNGEPGDIIPLGYLFREAFNGTLEVGEGMALINGSPVASAALADAAVSSRRFIDRLERIFALAALAVAAPLQHFDEEFESLWNDPYIAASLRAIRQDLQNAGGVKHLAYQAPVSFRSTPRMFGWFRRTTATVQELACTALQTSSNNPAYFSQTPTHPEGAVLSNGGYHHPYASPALDALTRSYADIAQLLAALNNQVIEGPGGLLGLEPEAEVATLYHVTTGWAEEARAAATASLISLGNSGQTDTGTLDLLAWRKSDETSRAVEASSTILAISAAHAISRKGLEPQGELGQFHREIVELFPVGTKPIGFGKHLEAVRLHLYGSN